MKRPGCAALSVELLGDVFLFAMFIAPGALIERHWNCSVLLSVSSGSLFLAVGLLLGSLRILLAPSTDPEAKPSLRVLLRSLGAWWAFLSLGALLLALLWLANALTLWAFGRVLLTRWLF